MNEGKLKIVPLGESDIAELVLRAPGKIGILNMGEDGVYTAWEGIGPGDIDEKFEVAFEGDYWLKIYDDRGMVYNKNYNDTGYRNYTIYAAPRQDGGRTVLINWHE